MKKMKKRILGLFCISTFIAMFATTSQVFATADFDLKVPTTSKNHLAAMDFLINGTKTSTTKVIKNVKDVWCQIDVTSVTGTETLTINAEYSLDDVTYGSISAIYMVQVTNTLVTSTTASSGSGSDTGFWFAPDYGGTHTTLFGGAYANTVTGSSSFYRMRFPTECFVKIKGILTNGASSPASKWKVSFIDVDPFGHNPKNP